jgi:predicted phosphodiesterase
MRLGLIADIHGNLLALDVVLQALADEQVDHIICLGDIGSLGPQPREVIDRLRQLRCPVILGNTDAWLLEPPVATQDTPEDGRVLREINRWCADQLEAEDRAYLQTLPPTYTYALDEENTMLCFHGSPRSFDDVIAAVTPDAVVAEMPAGASARILVGGHTHIQMVRRYEASWIVNVGSVGLPGVNAGSPELPKNRQVRWAEYGVVSSQHGQVSLELRRAPVDVAALLQTARRSGMPHFDWWARLWGTS